MYVYTTEVCIILFHYIFLCEGATFDFFPFPLLFCLFIYLFLLVFLLFFLWGGGYLGESILSRIFVLDFGTVPRVWYFLFFIL